MGRLLLLLIFAPFVELYLLFALGSAVGAGPVIAWVLLTGMAGIGLARHQGLTILHSWRTKLASGELPEQGVLHGALLVLGAILLVIPGLLSDLMGIGLMISFLRKSLATYIRRQIENRSATNTVTQFDMNDSKVVVTTLSQLYRSSSGPAHRQPEFSELSSPSRHTVQRIQPSTVDAEIIDAEIIDAEIIDAEIVDAPSKAECEARKMPEQDLTRD